MPLTITSDRDPKFTRHFWKALFRMCGTDLNQSSAYHHDTDGQVERVNLGLEDYLRHYVSGDQRDWSEHLVMAEFKYNSTVHSATGFAPFFLATGRSPRTPTWFSNPRAWTTASKVPAADTFIQERREAIEAATASMARNQSRYKEQSDKSRREVSFEIGERVWVQLRPNQFHESISRKLAPRYAGPYRILRRAHESNPMSFVLEVPESMVQNKSYHVSVLKKFVEDEDPNRQQVLRPEAELVQDVEEYEVEAILQHKFKKLRGRNVLYYLVHWKGYDQCKRTWKPEEHLKNAPQVVNAYQQCAGLSPS